MRSQVELADAKQNLVNAENNYDLSISSLNNLIGLSIDTKINIQDELKYTKYDLSLAECMDLAMTNRPDGVAAAKAIEQAKASVKAAQAGNLHNFLLMQVTLLMAMMLLIMMQQKNQKLVLKLVGTFLIIM